MNSRVLRQLMMVATILLSLVLFSCGDEEEEPKPINQRVSSFQVGGASYDVVYDNDGNLVQFLGTSEFAVSAIDVTYSEADLSMTLGDGADALFVFNPDSTIASINQYEYSYINKELVQIYDGDGNWNVTWENMTISRIEFEDQSSPRYREIISEEGENLFLNLHPAITYMLGHMTPLDAMDVFFTPKRISQWIVNGESTYNMFDYSFNEYNNLTGYLLVDDVDTNYVVSITWENF